MSGSNCCFVTGIQVSQESGKVAWYPHLFKNFPQFVVIHTVKDFSIVTEAEVDIFLVMEAQVISHPASFNFLPAFRLGFYNWKSLREHLVQPSIFGLVKCDYHCLKGKTSDAQAGGLLRCPRKEMVEERLWPNPSVLQPSSSLLPSGLEFASWSLCHISKSYSTVFTFTVRPATPNFIKVNAAKYTIASKAWFSWLTFLFYYPSNFTYENMITSLGSAS